jgi:hypothetical protein
MFCVVVTGKKRCFVVLLSHVSMLIVVTSFVLFAETCIFVSAGNYHAQTIASLVLISCDL